MRAHLLPSPAFFVPQALAERRFQAAVRQAAGRGDVVHFTHAYCLDGAACDVLVRAAHPGQNVSTAYLEPHESVAALQAAATVPARGRALVVSDLSFQQGQGPVVAAALAALKQAGWTVSWRDHHHRQWVGADLDALNAHAAVTLDTTGTECGATLVTRDLLAGDTFATAFSTLVRDHDLWLREDPRSVRLAAAVAHAGSKRFVAHVLGAREPWDTTLSGWADAEDARKAALVRDAIAHARRASGARAHVMVAYGRVPTNDVLHPLEEQGAHLSVLLKPEGTFSLRSRKDVPVCQDVASRFGGGGHPNASGGKLRVPALAWPAFWARRGDAGPARELVAACVTAVDRHLHAQENV